VKVHYKTDIIERLDDTVNEAMANMIEIDYIALSPLEWHLFIARMHKLMLRADDYKGYRAARINGETIFRGVRVVREEA
jgi:hypothetical protein